MHKLVSMWSEGLKVHNSNIDTDHNFSDCYYGGSAALDFLAYRSLYRHINEYTWRARNHQNCPGMLLLKQ